MIDIPIWLFVIMCILSGFIAFIIVGIILLGLVALIFDITDLIVDTFKKLKGKKHD